LGGKNPQITQITQIGRNRDKLIPLKQEKNRANLTQFFFMSFLRNLCNLRIPQ